MLAYGTRRTAGLALLISAYIVVACISLRLGYYYRESYIMYDAVRLPFAIAAVAAFALIAPLFVFARFSFGYFCGFYFYSMILGYLWLNCFSHFDYNHHLAGLSAAVSAVAFLLPALLITSPIKQLYVMPERQFVHLLKGLTLFSAVILAIASGYNFKLIVVSDIYEFREHLSFPLILDYAIGAVTSVVLPFVFTGFLALKNPWRAAIVLLIALSFYPVTLSKIALFTPVWLIAMALLLRLFEARITVILSLFLPILLGVILIILVGETTRDYFNLVNMRMIMVPSSAMDIYNEYFARHEHTYFCQIRVLKPFVPCALEHPLSVEMQNNYALGNYNASLFATEGIASVGLWLAPISVFACGLVIAVGNRLSAGLPSSFILTSSAILAQVLLNVPLTTVLLTHGAAILFLLWYLTPRSIFQQQSASGPSSVAHSSPAE